MKIQEILLIYLSLLGPVMLSCSINPLATYTPLSSIAQAATLQYLVNHSTPTQPVTPVQSPSSQSITPSESITPAEINPQGDQISTSGSYVLEQSINFTGTTSPLTITASNIIIDLNGLILDYRGPELSTTSGITVSPGVTNVTIKNGIIAGFPGAGILVAGTESHPVAHLTLDTLTIVSCGAGASFVYANDIKMNNCTITGSTNLLSAYGIYAQNCSGVAIQHCISRNNTSTTGACYGYFFDTCNTVFLGECTSSLNQGATTVSGFCFNNVSQTSYIQNCSAISNVSSAGESSGISLNGSQQCYIQNSTSQGNITRAPHLFSYGILLHNSSNNFLKHNAIDNNSYGIYDDEASGSETNLYTQNIAYQNTVADYLRPHSSALSFTQIQQDYLQKILLAGTLDNISIRVTPS